MTKMSERHPLSQLGKREGRSIGRPTEGRPSRGRKGRQNPQWVSLLCVGGKKYFPKRRGGKWRGDRKRLQTVSKEKAISLERPPKNNALNGQKRRASRRVKGAMAQRESRGKGVVQENWYPL